MTLIELITQALIAIGVARPNQTLSATQSDNAKNTLNILVDSWNADGLMIYFTTSETQNLTATQAAYTWGTSGSPSFTSARPVRVLRSFIRVGSIDYPVEVIGGDQYQMITLKTTAGRPDYVWYNPTYPNGTLTFYPVPDAAYAWYVDTEKDLVDFSVLTTTISLPPEYMAALKWNLAIQLCPNYNKEPSMFLMKMAQDSKDTVERINAANKVEPVDLGLFTASIRGRSNIFTG